MSIEHIIECCSSPLQRMSRFFRNTLYGSTAALVLGASALGCSDGQLRNFPPDMGQEEEVCTDNDKDNFYAQKNCGTEVDCDDVNSRVYPGAIEFCDYLDNNCDEQVDEGAKVRFWEDLDRDGSGGNKKFIEACTLPSEDPKKGVRYSADNDDCNDADPAIHPKVAELCDSIDNNCDGEADEGFNMGEACYDGIGSCRQPGIYVCTEDRLTSYCTAVASTKEAEICDGIDNDCDGSIDEGVLRTFYLDSDGDLFGNATETAEACTPPEGFVANALDCDDTDPERWFYMAGFTDADGDGYGAGDIAMLCVGTNLPEGYVANDLDCHDGDYNIRPGVVERCDTVDNNCNGANNETFNDGDPCFDGLGDCLSIGEFTCTADGTATYCSAIRGESSPEECDGRDNDCNTRIDDGLAVPSQACTVGVGACEGSGTEYRTCLGPEGWSPDYSGCTAVAGEPSPEACDGLNNDCDASTDEDLTPPSRPCTWGDGVCTSSGLEYSIACLGEAGWSPEYRGCDAVLGESSPEACDGLDNDCDASTDEDLTPLSRPCTRGVGACAADGLEYQICLGAAGWSADYSGCDAVLGEPSPEVCDGLDNDCDALTDEGCPCTGTLDIGGCVSDGLCSLLLSDNGEIALDGSSPVSGTPLTNSGWRANGGTSESSQYSNTISRSAPLALSATGWNGAGVYALVVPSVAELHASIWYRVSNTGADAFGIGNSDFSTQVRITTGGACGADNPFEYSRIEPGIAESRVDISGVPTYEANRWYHMQVDAVGRFVAVAIDDGISGGSACIELSAEVDWSRVQLSTDRCGGGSRTSYWDDFVAVTR